MFFSDEGPFLGTLHAPRFPYIGSTPTLYALKGNCHELRMHLSKFVCANMPGFLVTFRSRNLLLSGVISFAAKGPSYAGSAHDSFPSINAFVFALVTPH